MKVFQCSAWGGSLHYSREFDSANVDSDVVQSATSFLDEMRAAGSPTEMHLPTDGASIRASLAVRPGCTEILDVEGATVRKYTVIPGDCDQDRARELLHGRVAGSAAAEQVNSGRGRASDSEQTEARARIEATVAEIAARLPVVFTVSSPASQGVALTLEVDSFVANLAVAILLTSEY